MILCSFKTKIFGIYTGRRESLQDDRGMSEAFFFDAEACEMDRIPSGRYVVFFST